MSAPLTDRADRSIAVGDLVQVVNSCCKRRGDQFLGAIFKVSDLVVGTTGCSCGWKPNGTIKAKSETVFCGDGTHCPTQWLKRIPPLDELEGQRTEENLKEPT